MYSFRWALVDIETTRLHVLHDEIPEIAVIILTDLGVERQWHRLIKPRRSIPKTISTLTGITNELVKDAPYFEAIACDLLEVLEGCVFVAHNARFDFGFIKNAFKKVALTYLAPVLCTVKLLKQLHPNQPYYNLAYSAISLGLTLQNHHRAQDDVYALYQILENLSAQHSRALILDAAKTIYQKSSIPSKLTTDICTPPNTAGVYLFMVIKMSCPYT